MIPTYILAPSFNYHPDTSICIGDIVQYPEDPTKPLSSIPKAKLEKLVTSHFDYDNELSNQNTQSLRGSVWANFLEYASARTGSGAADESLDEYTIRRLETIYFIKQPTDKEAAERVKEDLVQAAVNSGILGKKPVFMITGLKVARGFQWTSKANSTKNVDGEVAAKFTPDVGAGTEYDYSRGNTVEKSSRTGQDIIFAYQLHIITHKGWWLGAKKHVDITLYKAPAAFLSDDKEGEEEDSVGMVEASESLIRTFDEELEVKTVSARNGDEECVCLVLRDG
ncbi:hypothetical protein FPOAC2_00120 [Fusarium poae]|jgi:hypothetical protein|uniref:hypothetical protein n=1 Tax=Fusarium poae TaxID=36050 RepID=UPI001CE7A409|nr:hypothetical protein FPOAC1_000107 [Fusarium poae]KAG8674144.1 hypothetical protein FPOAC1_000107 [Fusarium poae]